MFTVLAKFSASKARAKELMAGHGKWLQRGMDDGVSLMAGGLQPGLGGALLVHDVALSELDARLAEDPFVAHDVVRSETTETSPSGTDPRLEFLNAVSGT